MFEKINEIKEEASNFNILNLDDLDEFRIRFLGSKGLIKELFSYFKDVPNEQKKEFGQKLNEIKIYITNKFETLKAELQKQQETTNTPIDITKTGKNYDLGTKHPISIVRDKILETFKKIGYTIKEGQEIEDDWHNFSALNFPLEHPARDMQDTFFIKMNSENSKISLRTHTSSVQVRVMETEKPPIRIIVPGRVYRNEAISARAHCFFHQVEGLYIYKDVSFLDLKQSLMFFVQDIFGKNVKIRLRPSYFPFTEPSAEMDISCTLCKSKGCNVCKYNGWLEIMGCGMVDPNVLENCKIDSKIYSGFAFGMGIERIAQLLFEVNDLRLYSENDIRFLNQFKNL